MTLQFINKGKLLHLLNVKVSSTISLLLNLVERMFAIQQRNDEEKRKYAKEHEIKLIEISYKNKKYEIVESILRNNHII